MRSPREWVEAFGYVCDGCGYDRWGEPRRWRQYRLCAGCIKAVLTETPSVRINALYGVSDGERRELRAELGGNLHMTGLEATVARETEGEVFARKDLPDNPGPQNAQGVLWPYVDGQFVPDLPTGWVEEWDKNPRKAFDDAALSELAESIRQDGVQQPIVVRLTGVIGAGSLRRPVLQTIMGERRLRASRLAGRHTIPAFIRTDMDDRTALRLAVVENLKRRDLNPMEEADSYRALLDEGYSQKDIAGQISISEAAISNALRLRKLPDTLRALVLEGTLTGSHARALLRFEGFEAVQSKIAQLAVEQGVSAKYLEKEVPFEMELAHARLVDYPTHSQYNLRPICEACPFNAYRKGTNDRMVCLKPAHLAELIAQEKQAADARRQAVLEEVERKKQEALKAAKAVEKDQAAQALVGALLGGMDSKQEADSEAGTGNAAQGTAGRTQGDSAASDENRSETVGTGTAGSAAPAVSPAPLTLPELCVRDLSYDQFSYFNRDTPAECQSDCSTCPCRVQARDHSGEGTMTICLDPKRQASLKAKDTRAKQVGRKQKFGDYAEKLFALDVGLTDSRALAVLLWHSFDYLPKDVVKRLLPDVANTALASILQQPRYERKKLACYEALATFGFQRVLTLALRASLLYEMDSVVKNHGDHYPDTQWYFGEIEAESEKPAWERERETEAEDDVLSYVTCAECGKEICETDIHCVVREEDEFGQTLESGVYVMKRGEGESGCVLCPSCAQEAQSENGDVPAYQRGQAVEVALGSLTNGSPKWTPAVVAEDDLPYFLKAGPQDSGMLRVRVGGDKADVPITWRPLDHVRPASEPKADEWEDPACADCGVHRAEAGGKCRHCLEAEASRAQEAVCSL